MSHWDLHFWNFLSHLVILTLFYLFIDESAFGWLLKKRFELAEDLECCFERVDGY
jgi:hypothetical protein